MIRPKGRKGDVAMKKSNFISALMFLIDVLSKLFKEIKKLGGTEDAFYSLKDENKIKKIADMLISTKGVKHGRLVMTTTGKDLS